MGSWGPSRWPEMGAWGPCAMRVSCVWRGGDGRHAYVGQHVGSWLDLGISRACICVNIYPHCPIPTVDPHCPIPTATVDPGAPRLTPAQHTAQAGPQPPTHPLGRLTNLLHMLGAPVRVLFVYVPVCVHASVCACVCVCVHASVRVCACVCACVRA